MGLGYPLREEAEQLWQEGMDYRAKNTPYGPNSPAYIVHTQNVAKFAYKIAEKTKALNPEKAYVLGLLHDYGKRISERKANVFHGLEGYHAMISFGYSDVAKICLTHTFPNKDFPVDAIGYPRDWMMEAKQILNNVEYDDYDRLIQFCDKLSDGAEIVSIEKRATLIRDRYNSRKEYSGISEERYETLLSEGLFLKKYFDEACGEDTYKLIGIK
ncbi:MAG: HD domain-containing protein [Alphaproteobacteria bacterium]|nr:HD domain-containing protein [Alphaproteobacteria bacterium]